MRALVERACRALAFVMPRELVYACGMRILAEVTNRPELSKVSGELYVGEVRMLHALDSFINVRK
jgi:hypothetical protein